MVQSVPWVACCKVMSEVGREGGQHHVHPVGARGMRGLWCRWEGHLRVAVQPSPHHAC